MGNTRKEFEMPENKIKPATVEDYIAQFSPDVQQILARIRAVIIAAVPGVEEKISYSMPGYYLNGWLVWFAANKHHIGLYPRISVEDEAYHIQLSAYPGTKGSFHFPLNQPIPYELIGKIAAFRAAQSKIGRMD